MVGADPISKFESFVNEFGIGKERERQSILHVESA